MLHRKDLNVRAAEPSRSCCSPNSYNTHTNTHPQLTQCTWNTNPIHTSLNQIFDKSHKIVSLPYYQRNPQTPAFSGSSWATMKASSSEIKKIKVKCTYSILILCSRYCCFKTITLTRLNAPTPSFTPPSKWP